MTINERIRQVRKEHLLTQVDFAAKLKISGQAVSLIEKGVNKPSDQTISIICREFRVREEWLRTGKGPMKVQLSRFDELESFVADLKTQAPDFRHRFLTLLAKLSPEQWSLLEEMALSLVEETQEKETFSPQQLPIPSELKNVHEWTDAEMHAELQRQLDAEKRETP